MNEQRAIVDGEPAPVCFICKWRTCSNRKKSTRSREVVLIGLLTATKTLTSSIGQPRGDIIKFSLDD